MRKRVGGGGGASFAGGAGFSSSEPPNHQPRFFFGFAAAGSAAAGTGAPSIARKAPGAQGARQIRKVAVSGSATTRRPASPLANTARPRSSIVAKALSPEKARIEERRE